MTKRHCAGAVRPKRVIIQTLGCPKNQVDSETFAGILRASGFEYVQQPHLADVLVVNTCGFLDDAKLESVETLLEATKWKSRSEGRQVIAMGCLTQRDGDEVRDNIPELDGVFGIGEWGRMLDLLGANPVASTAGESDVMFTAGRSGPGSAFLRVSDGCSHACAFCAIPQMRGLYRSEPIDLLISEAKRLAQSGIKEIILIGQETTSYGVDLYRQRRIVELCMRLSEIEGIHWIRLLYAHPPSTPPKLMEELARVPKLCPYIDFPIEHAAEGVLKAMNRRTTAARMKDSIEAFRSVLPNACVRTTVLVGFPGETDEDFDCLYQYMSDIRFERAGVFTYSPQEGTAGAGLPGKVEEGIALDRLDRLMKLQRQICLEKHQGLVGKEIDVLVERKTRSALWGRSAWDAPEIDARVRIDGEAELGTIIRARITKAASYQIDGSLRNPSHGLTRGDLCGDFGLPVLSRP